MKFYALIHHYNEDKVTPYNVISDELIERVRKNKRKSYEEIREEVKGYLMARYWSRCEYEFVVSQWTGKDFEQKIDIWYQLEPNLDLITKMLIKHVSPRRKLNEN